MTKTSHLPLEPAWDQPSSWLHRKPMQTGLATVISVQCTSTGGRCAKGKRTEKWQTVCFIAFDCVRGYAAILLPCMPVLCCVPPPLRMQIWLFPHSWQSRATTWHGSGPLWSFGFLCFLLSHGGLNDTYCALLRHIQITPVSSTHWFIDRNIAGYVLVAEMYKERSLPTDNKNDQGWGELRKNWKLTARCHIVYRSACHNHCSLRYSSHRHGGCHSHSPCHGGCGVVCARGGCDRHCVIVVVTSASLQGHGCQGSKEKCSLTVPVMTWISFKKHWNAMHTFFEIRNYMYLCHPNLKHNFVVNNPGLAAPQRMMGTRKHPCR